MNPLPAPIADPLHVLPPANLLALMALAAFLLPLALLIQTRVLRRRQRTAEAPPPVPQPPSAGPLPAAPIGDRIATIERKFTRSKAFRDGCHTLAAEVKQHLAQVTGIGVEEMTSAEIAETFERGVPVSGRRIGGPTLGLFMRSLARRRFSRHEPRRRHFVEACGKARELLT